MLGTFIVMGMLPFVPSWQWAVGSVVVLVPYLPVFYWAHRNVSHDIKQARAQGAVMRTAQVRADAYEAGRLRGRSELSMELYEQARSELLETLSPDSEPVQDR